MPGWPKTPEHMGDQKSTEDAWWEERSRSEREARFEIPPRAIQPPPEGPKVHYFSSRIDEGIEIHTNERASVSARLHRGRLLHFDFYGTTDELRALYRALGAKIREVTEGT